MNNENHLPTKEELRKRMDDSLALLLTVLDDLSEEEMLVPTDAAGWAVRDHMTHLVAWADGISALLRRQDRWAAMGLDSLSIEYATIDIDAVNDEIMRKNRHISPADAYDEIIRAHNGVIEAMSALDDASLMLPYDRFVAPFSGDEGYPIYAYIRGNTEEHYQEHIPWIKTIVNGSSQE